MACGLRNNLQKSLDLHSVNPPFLIYGEGGHGLGFSKNHRRGKSTFLVKMEGEAGSPYMEAAYRRKGKHCFSLMMYEFCSSNALYLASLWFRMFSFDYFDTWNSYFTLILSLVLLIKVLFTRNDFATSLFLCVSVFHWGDIVIKVLPKAGGLKKI